MVPRPTPPSTPSKSASKVQIATGSATLSPGYNTIVLSVSGGASVTGNSAATNVLTSKSANLASTPSSSGTYLGLNARGNTLTAGTSAATTIVGGAGNDFLLANGSSGNVLLSGGSGSSTMVAGSGKATLIGGSLFNSLVAGSGDQSLIGGSNSPTTSYLNSNGTRTFTVNTGNTLRGGTGRTTLVGGTGYNTLISGSIAPTLTLATAAAKGISAIRVSSPAGLKVGQPISGAGIASGTTITAISGNTVQLSKKTTSASQSGAALASTTTSNTLIGNGISSSLVAGGGNDSLVAGTSASSTLIGGIGRTTLAAGTQASSTSWLQSGASNTPGAPGNTLIGSSQASASVTLVAASATDSIAAGPGNNTFVLNAVNKDAFAGAKFSLGTFSTNPYAQVTGSQVISIASVNGASGTSGTFEFNDSLLSGITGAFTSYRATQPGSGFPVALVNNLGKAMAITLGDSAGTLGLNSVVAGSVQGSVVGGSGVLFGDTIDASTDTLGLTLNAGRSRMPVSLVGTPQSDLVYLSQAGSFALKDIVRSGDGNDTLTAQNTLFGSLDGGANSDLLDGGDSLSSGDMLALNFGSASLSALNFGNIQNMENLLLLSGANVIGSLQGSGIRRIIGGTGSDTLAANAVGLVATATNIALNPYSITLQLPAGTPINGTLGFTQGQRISGNGISPGTVISNITPYQVADGSGTMILTLDKPLSVNVARGRPIVAWFDRVTLDGSRNSGSGITNQNATLDAAKYVKELAAKFDSPVGNDGEEITNASAFLDALKTDSRTFIHLSGNSLTGLGSGVFLIGPEDVERTLNLGTTYTFRDLLYKQTSNSNSGLPLSGNSTVVSAALRYVNDSTLNSSADSTNTLVGNSGSTVYLLNNVPNNTPDNQPGIPTILLHRNTDSLEASSFGPAYLATAKSGTNGELRFAGDNLNLVVGENFSGVTPGAINRISVANGRNLLQILPSSGISQDLTLNGGNGSDTLYTSPEYTSNVYLEAIRGSGPQSLSSGQGDDTILAGSGNATINAGDGNNSLIGGAGTNLISSGVGNSTLDGGNGASTLQAVGGQNLMVIRNRRARIILDTVSPNPDNTPLELTVNTYVNFDPIQSTEVDQYAPTNPDGSPSITKSPSFASADLSSFYTIKNFNLLADFTAGTGAVYGIGNALDNAMVQGRDPGVLNPNENIINNPTGALMLGMGGNNTLISWGGNSSLYGFSNESYASPDLYASAPTDTRTRDFITNVMGTPGNNLLVANGSGSFLDGGPGYNAGTGAAASNTLVGNASNATFVIRHRADSVVAAAGSNTVYSTVDLNSLPANITEAVLVVADQNQYLRNFSANAPVLPSNSGQDAPATYLSYGSSQANSSVTHSVRFNHVTLTAANSSQLQVQYGTYALNHFQSDNVPTPDTQTRDQYFPLIVSDPLPDTTNPGMVAYQLDWNADLMRNTGVVAGYTVLYRVQDDGTGQPGAWKTYVNGTSQDLQGTTDNPALMVDNLDAGFTYDFQVTASQLQHPFSFDSLGNEVATPVTLRGNSGNDVIWTYTGSSDSLESGQNLGTSTWYRNVNPVLGNNPAAPLPAGTIPLTGPYALSQYDSPLFPVYLDGADGNNLLLSNLIGNGDGSSITIEAGTSANPQTLTYSGFNTMAGGYGSDTFVVANGTQNNFDLCFKYGNETPVDYTKTAPGVPSSLGSGGVSLNGGRHNLIASSIDRIQLSDTTVSQGMFVDMLLLLGGAQFGMGNRLDNFIYDVDQDGLRNTLVGNTGRDSILSQQRGELLIGGTAALGDDISQAMLGLYGARPSIVGGVAGYFTNDGSENFTIPVTSSTPTLQGSATVFSAYRDSDPVPSTIQGGPGGADPSQYWMVPGSGNYDPLRNSDTLIAIPGRAGDSLSSVSTLDGGAGADSLFGGAGSDYLVVSTGGIYGENFTGPAYSNFFPVISTRDNATGTMYGGYGDVVVGNGGNDTICFTGSDLWWSGNPTTYNTGLTYVLNRDGDALGGQSISNIILQNGAVNAYGAIGSAYTTGNQTKGNLGNAELGSNKLIGNQFSNYLDGDGVGGSGGTGYGADTLTGGGGSDFFVIGANYRNSTQNAAATYTTAQSPTTPVVNTYTTTQDKAATDADYAIITDFETSGSSTDFLILKAAPSGGTSPQGYAVGIAPSSFSRNNIPQGASIDTQKFGIYYVNGTGAPNLVAQIQTNSPISLGSTFLTVAGQPVNGSSFGGASFAWTTGTGADLNTGGLNYLGFGAMYPLASTSFSNFVQYTP